MMSFPNETTLSTIRNDEFCYRTLDGARLLLLVHFADWEYISRKTGRPPIDNADVLIIYDALSALLGTGEFPKGIDKVEVTVGGTKMKASTLLELGAGIAGKL